MAGKWEKPPGSNEGESEPPLSPFEKRLNELSPEEQKEVRPIVEQVGELSGAQQRAIYTLLYEKRVEKAKDVVKLTSRDPRARDFFHTQQNSKLFITTCRDADVAPTKAEFIDLINGDGEAFSHINEIRKSYEVYDEILRKLGF